ncbi:MAG: cyclic nucleotide-binding domain-containing protein, partial [Chitinivibrionales bacterium]|nr:cyclic nucleotide-binding domain-containing protein [Chitinivibrionales bacterium]
YSPDEIIVKEQDVGDTLYIIKWGTVSIVKHVADAGTIALATLSQGEFFGDMAVFDAEVRSASVVAKSQCLLLRINGDDLKEVIVDNPRIAIELLRIFVKRLRSANATIETLSRKDHKEAGES